jgi:hypothetical protein
MRSVVDTSGVLVASCSLSGIGSSFISPLSAENVN